MSDLQDLGCLKYSELQKLAKDVGIKANMKSDKLIKALEEHFKNHPSSSSSSYQAVKSDAVNTVSEETINTQLDIPKEQLDECEKPRPTRKAKKGKGRKKKVNKKLDLTDDGMDVNKVKSVEVERCKRKLSESDCDAEVQFKPLENGDDNSSESRPSKRRRETFEVVPSPLIKGDNAVTDRGDNLTADHGDNNDSLGEVMDAMKPEMSNTDLKDSLMAAIEKKVEQKISAEGDKEISTTTASHIPRFAAFLAKKKAADKKPITPGNKDWTKIHEKNFSKMDSIDVYLEKKRQRNQSISNSIKEAHEVASKTRETMNKLASHKTPVSLKVTKGLPLPFKPTVTSTKSMSFNFADTSKTPVFGARRKSAAGPAIPPKCDSQASLTRKSPRNAENTSVPGVRVQARKSVGSAINITLQAERRKSHVTPFKALNVTADNTSHKKVFDLAASLSKPLSWKPYTGKLKPLEPKVSNNKPKPLEPKLSNLNRTKPLEPKVSNIIRPKPLEGKLSSNSHYRNNSLKAPPLQNSRANRFADAKQRQADRKFNAQMKRRGIVA